MMGGTETADMVEALVWAYVAGDRPRLLGLLDGLLRGPKWNAFAVTFTLAAAVGESVTLPPGETFHRVKVTHLDPDGTTRQGSADDLPPYIRLFARMVAAINNGDRDLAKDLFIGTVGEHASRARDVILHGLGELVRWGLAGVGGGGAS